MDCLAVAVGNVHFVTSDHVPEIRIDRITEIREAVQIPLVLHGGSGTPDDQQEHFDHIAELGRDPHTDILTRIGRERALTMLEKMVEIRPFEQMAYLRYLQKEIPGTLHQTQGQEAVAVGVCTPLRDSDPITSAAARSSAGWSRKVATSSSASRCSRWRPTSPPSTSRRARSSPTSASRARTSPRDGVDAAAPTRGGTATVTAQTVVRGRKRVM